MCDDDPQDLKPAGVALHSFNGLTDICGQRQIAGRVIHLVPGVNNQHVAVLPDHRGGRSFEEPTDRDFLIVDRDHEPEMLIDPCIGGLDFGLTPLAAQIGVAFEALLGDVPLAKLTFEILLRQVLERCPGDAEGVSVCEPAN